MFERYSENGRKAVYFARQAAGAVGAREVQLEHLLIALMQIEPELWRKAAGRRTCIRIDRLIQFSVWSGRNTPVPPSAEMPLGEAVKQAFHLAEAEVRDSRGYVIGTDHLLLGLLKTEGGGRLVETLRRYGVTYQVARARILGEAVDEEQAPSVFERYTERARRVIFFARYEAGVAGADSIGPEHLLIGLVREDKPLWRKIAGPEFDSTLAAELRGAVGTPGIRKPTSVDMPLDEAAKVALVAAEAEAEGSNSIHTSHLLLGLLKNGADHPMFEMLKRHGITYEIVRVKLYGETGGGAGA